MNKKESPTETDSDEFKKDEKATKLYFNICSEFLAVKLSVAQEAYKTYIKIIKWHGSKYIKTSINNAEKTDAKVEEKPVEDKPTGDANSNNEKLDKAGK